MKKVSFELNSIDLGYFISRFLMKSSRILPILIYSLISLIMGHPGSWNQQPPEPKAIVQKTILVPTKAAETSRQGGAITLDPVSIISLLALGAFLINTILQLLRTNTLMNQAGRTLQGSQALEIQTQASIRRIDDFGNTLCSLGALYFLNPVQRKSCLLKILCDAPTWMLGAKTEKISVIHSLINEFIKRGQTKDMTKACKIATKTCLKKNFHNARHTIKSRLKGTSQIIANAIKHLL